MPTTIKRNKRPVPRPPKPPVGTKFCHMCGLEKPITEYYKSHSNVFMGLDNSMPVCKTCISSLYESYVTERQYSVRAAVMAVCRKLDIYFAEEQFAKAVDEFRNKPTRPLINIYIAKCNLMLQNKSESLCFEDSNIDEMTAERLSIVADPDREVTPDQKRKLIKFWGEGYNEPQMIRMQMYYEEYLRAYSSDLAKRGYFKMLAIEKLRLDEAETSKERSEIIKTITSLTKEANISPKDTEQSKSTDDKAILGVKIQEIENTEPVDYMVREKAAYMDVNKLGKLVKQYLYQPMSKLFGGE